LFVSIITSEFRLERQPENAKAQRMAIRKI